MDHMRDMRGPEALSYAADALAATEGHRGPCSTVDLIRGGVKREIVVTVNRRSRPDVFPLGAVQDYESGTTAE